MKNVHYEIILQSLTEDMLRQDAKIKNLQSRYDELKAVHVADTKAFWRDCHQKDRQIKELQDGIDKLTNEKKELAKSLQNSSVDKKEEDAQQKAISECVDLVNQIYDFCKEHDLRLSMDFVNDVNDGKVPRIGVWNNVDGDIALCHVTYSFDWIATLKRLINGAKNGYETWTQAKQSKHNSECAVNQKANKDGNNVSASPND